MIRNFLHMLVILSIVTLGISPACAFVSGKMSIEICKADGSVETIEVSSADFAPDSSSHEHQETKKQCQFCLTSSLISKHLSAPPILKTPRLIISAQQFAAFHTELLQYKEKSHAPRAPPALV